MSKRWAGLSLLLTLMMLSPESVLRAQGDTFQGSSRLAPGQILEVQGIAGEIRAVLAQGQEARVVAVKRGDRGDFPEVAVEVAEAGDRIVICAVYGSWKHGQGRCSPGFRDQGERDRRRNTNIDVKVDYEIHLPAGVAFQGTQVAGEIRGEGLRSDLVLTTVSGAIRASTSGRAEASSVSGDLEITMGDPGAGDMDYQTVSGDITLWLPADFNADLDFSSISGDFDSDFDLRSGTRRSRWVGMKVRGTIGEGGRDLSLNTVSGDVRLRRGQG